MEKRIIPSNEYGTAEIQNELLDIMKLFHAFCVRNRIKYSLYGGSCLGAVRHQGFIPWDDDLDICVDRKNYRKLRSLFEDAEGLSLRKTIWICRISKKDGKPIGSYLPTLDVFVIDRVPVHRIVFRLKLFLLAMLQGMLKEEVSYKGFSPVYKGFLFVTHMMGKPFSADLLRKWYDRVSAIGNRQRSGYVHCSNTSYKWIQNVYPDTTFRKVRPVPFEDAAFLIPEEYDSYLRICYGDYMKLPDESQRIPEHVK